MQFVLEKVTGRGVRVGKILWSSGHAPYTLDTPLCLPYTRAGAVPHLVSSLVQDLPPPCRPSAAVLPLPTLYEIPGSEVLKDHGRGIHHFLNLKDHLLYLSVQDPAHPPPSGYNGDKFTSLWTNGGRRKVTVDDYLQFVRASRPSVFECLCDSVSSEEQKLKRVRKSVDRTLNFLDQIITARQEDNVLEQCSVLGAVEGSDIVEERRRSAMETAKRPVNGFVLEGFDLTHSPDSLQTVIQCTTELLPDDKPRFIHGLYRPDDILTALEAGVDVFDGSYIYTATEKGCALTYPINIRPERVGKDNAISSPVPFEINLNETKYAEDFCPIAKDCSCYSCSNHTRAYVHHLLQTKEILASTLLMIHNFSQHMTFFANLRTAVITSEDHYTQYRSLWTM